MEKRPLAYNTMVLAFKLGFKLIAWIGKDIEEKEEEEILIIESRDKLKDKKEKKNHEENSLKTRMDKQN